VLLELVGVYDASPDGAREGVLLCVPDVLSVGSPDVVEVGLAPLVCVALLDRVPEGEELGVGDAVMLFEDVPLADGVCEGVDSRDAPVE
jgi:hypothetical protein